MLGLIQTIIIPIQESNISYLQLPSGWGYKPKRPTLGYIQDPVGLHLPSAGPYQAG